MLRKMAGKSQDLRRERNEACDHGILGVETGGTDAIGIDALAIPPLHAAGELIDLREIEPQRLADVAQGAARSVANDGGRQRRPFAAILAVDILNHLLAPFVLEVHVDIGRLVAFLGNEALEQHGHARGVDLGDPQTVANGGVGRRAAALAEYFLRTRELNDIVHGQKERLELELGDQAQFVLDVGEHGRRRARRPALRAAAHRQRAQMTRGRGAGRHDFLGVLVAQLVELESAALRNLERLREQRRGIQLAQALQGPQTALAVREYGVPRGLERRP